MAKCFLVIIGLSMVLITLSKWQQVEAHKTAALDLDGGKGPQLHRYIIQD